MIKVEEVSVVVSSTTIVDLPTKENVKVILLA